MARKKGSRDKSKRKSRKGLLLKGGVLSAIGLGTGIFLATRGKKSSSVMSNIKSFPVIKAAKEGNISTVIQDTVKATKEKSRVYPPRPIDLDKFNNYKSNMLSRKPGTLQSGVSGYKGLNKEERKILRERRVRLLNREINLQSRIFRPQGYQGRRITHQGMIDQGFRTKRLDTKSFRSRLPRISDNEKRGRRNIMIDVINKHGAYYSTNNYSHIGFN